MTVIGAIKTLHASASLLGGTSNHTGDSRSSNRRKAMEEAGKSKNGLAWGPSHSMDSDDTSRKKHAPVKEQNTETTKTTSSSSSEEDPQTRQNPIGRFLEKVFNEKDSDDAVLATADTNASPVLRMCSGSCEQFACFFPMENPMAAAATESPHSSKSLALSLEVNRTASSCTPAERRRQRHAEKIKESKLEMPLDTLEVVGDDIERSISELTMKSSYGEATAKIAENRRMAYYAVGKHHKNSGRGGNRRCYFTGKLILGGTPFYAGSVQQGLRTLVVFCLPSAVGLPKCVEQQQGEIKRSGSSAGKPALLRSASRESSIGVQLGTKIPSETAAKLGIIKRPRSRDTTAGSQMTSLDEWSLSIVEEDLDPNWGLDRDYLLQHLPDPDAELLQEMEERYPQQFETLPVQVRSEHCWRLFIKFCFFSGLPIAEGESHYKVRDDVAMEVYGEEIILSHDVMEAVNGESAALLRLPNRKTFRYLRKHYTQQSAKLSDAVFCRKSWELVRPEI